MNNKNNCLLCGRELVYYEKPRELSCSICGGKFTDNAACADGHYICSECHAKRGVELISALCRRTAERDPIAIMLKLMEQPSIHMHGPEHHVLVGAALLAAYKNCGGTVDIDAAMDEMVRRGRQLPGGICGFWGCCGAAVSAGIAVSIITGSTPLKREEWGLSNAMTAAALERIAASGGPRCCKRDSFAAVQAAAGFIAGHFGVNLQMPYKVACTFFKLNDECLGAKCPYFA